MIGWLTVPAAALLADFVVLAAIDVNPLVNIAPWVIAALVAWPIVRARRKDGTISDLNASLAAADRREQDLQKDLIGVQKRADAVAESEKACMVEAQQWKARYEEQSKYTAEAAVTHLEGVLVEHRDQVAARHEKMLEALQALAEKVNGG